VPLVPLIEHGLPLDWTRDPFDRLLAAHSAARRARFCTLGRAPRASLPGLRVRATLDDFMPWQFLGRMSDAELRAVWMYLESVPPKGSGNK
jgi:hypothetical protein